MGISKRPKKSVGELPWFQQKAGPELVLGIIGSIPLVLTGIVQAQSGVVSAWVVGLYFGSPAVYVLCSGWRFLVSRSQEVARYRHDAVDVACRMLRDELLDALDPDQIAPNRNRLVAVTAYLVTGKGSGLFQVVKEYGGDGRPANHHVLPWGVGSVGHSVVANVPLSGVRSSDDIDSFRTELSKHFAMPPELAMEVRHDMWSWLAIPVHVDNADLAEYVLFIDSSSKDCFPGAAAGSQPSKQAQIAFRACDSLSEHLKTK